ncbi:hypothetical protein N44_03380 [Microcystis aeruginosa NIES-44]|uniref:Uncharacterized protein n=1 Tax=Microcystis aeruginosa NIES-44 TaxID=449439 RepID=A0A0A1VVV7_MICAE|nr:hypothetical protein N44_03380 [Microcystis aeruginosa NIES-44]
MADVRFLNLPILQKTDNYQQFDKIKFRIWKGGTTELRNCL